MARRIPGGMRLVVSTNDPAGCRLVGWSRSSGLASLASDMLNRGLGGAVGSGTDIGGYFDYSTPPTTEELFNRWTEWATLSPVFRLHGSGRTGTHTLWQYGQDTVTATGVSRSSISTAAADHAPVARGGPHRRPIARLWWHHPSDPVARRQNQEWLLGPDVLVAPIVREGATARSVYFPARRSGGGSQCWGSPRYR